MLVSNVWMLFATHYTHIHSDWRKRNLRNSLGLGLVTSTSNRLGTSEVDVEMANTGILELNFCEAWQEAEDVELVLHDVLFQRAYLLMAPLTTDLRPWSMSRHVTSTFSDFLNLFESLTESMNIC